MKLNPKLYASLVLLCAGFASSAVFSQSSSEFVDVETGNDITCGLRLDGSLSCPVRHFVPRFELPDDMPSVVNVSVGNDFACVVQSDGFLRCWGDDGHGQLQVPSSGAPYHSVSAGEAHACAINNAGAIECWGLSTNNRLAAPDGTFIEVSVSEQDTCALTINGTVECWGANDSGTASPPDELPAAQQVVAGRSASCALLLDGSVQCWGLEFSIAEGGPFIDIDMSVSGTPDTGPFAEFCGLDVDGVIHCRFTRPENSGSDFQDVLDKIPDTPGYTALAVNGVSICAVNSAGIVECWERLDVLPIPGVDSGAFNIDTTTGLRAEIYSDNTVELFWDFPNNIHIAFAGHEILRDGEVFAFTPNASSFLDTELQAGVPVVYTVRRVQVDGSTGDLSEAITVDTADRVGGPEETMSGSSRGDVTLVSADAAGVPGNRSSFGQSISADGRFVAFASKSDNLVPEDSNGFTHVFLKNVETGAIVKVSQDALGVEGNGFSLSPSVSADGGFVAFGSTSTNLVQGDTNESSDVYVKNVETGEIVRVSQDVVGVEGDRNSFNPSISADGRFVAFGSTSTNLVPEDTNSESDVFVKNVETGEIVRVSQDAMGVEGNQDSFNPSISADGRFVAFDSDANNLVPGDTDDNSDVFVKNVVTGEIVRVSEDASGAPVNGFSFRPSISADGRFVAFNVVPEDQNDNPDVFVKNVVTGEIIRVNEEAGGAQGNRISVKPSISADGRFVAFDSDVNELEPGDTTDKFGVSVKNLETGEIVRVSAAATEGDGPSISADGRFVAFESFTSNLVPEDINDNEFGEDDVFLANVVWPDAATLLLNLRYVVYSVTAAELFWDRIIDNGDVLYEVTRNGALIGKFDALSVFEDDLIPGVNYTYTVTAIDSGGNRSATVTTSLVTGDGSDSNFPTGIRAKVYSATAAELFWDRPAPFGITYEVERDGVVVGRTNGVSYFDDSLSGGKRYLYRIIAIDLAGNRSEYFAKTFLTTTEIPD